MGGGTFPTQKHVSEESPESKQGYRNHVQRFRLIIFREYTGLFRGKSLGRFQGGGISHFVCRRVTENKSNPELKN